MVLNKVCHLVMPGLEISQTHTLSISLKKRCSTSRPIRSYLVYCSATSQYPVWNGSTTFLQMVSGSVGDTVLISIRQSHRPSAINQRAFPSDHCLFIPHRRTLVNTRALICFPFLLSFVALPHLDFGIFETLRVSRREKDEMFVTRITIHLNFQLAELTGHATLLLFRIRRFGGGKIKTEEAKFLTQKNFPSDSTLITFPLFWARLVDSRHKYPNLI